MMKTSKMRENIDQEGHDMKFDVREDEEQSVKLNQIIELLLAAGYFRARIKGLSPFDKVVGGMTWCITTCNFDVDVDLLFQENSTIGQKIALTEKIVAVLPRMKCPHRIEPHQIQGLDFIHIFPVVQWLVKRAIETREEMGDYIRAYSISQFEKHHSMPEDVTFRQRKVKSTGSINNVQHAYRPQRKYRSHKSTSRQDEEVRVQCTLLEYGYRKGLTKSKTDDKSEGDARKLAAGSGLEAERDTQVQEEEQRIKKLLSGMSSTEGEGRLTASAIGSILQPHHIQQMASEYAEKQAELSDLEKSSPAGGGLQHHKRQTASLQKQIKQRDTVKHQIDEKHKELKEKYLQTQQKLKEGHFYKISTKDAEDAVGRHFSDAHHSGFNDMTIHMVDFIHANPESGRS